jgi:hypothetical protein
MKLPKIGTVVRVLWYDTVDANCWQTAKQAAGPQNDHEAIECFGRYLGQTADGYIHIGSQGKLKDNGIREFGLASDIPLGSVIKIERFTNAGAGKLVKIVLSAIIALAITQAAVAQYHGYCRYSDGTCVYAVVTCGGMGCTCPDSATGLPGTSVASCGATTPTPVPTATPVPGGNFCQSPAGLCWPFPSILGNSCDAPNVQVAACPTPPTPTPVPTAAPTPTPTPVVTPVVSLTQVPIVFPSDTFLYAPECVIIGPATTPTYLCVPTAGDRINLYTSQDGKTWANQGPVLTALCGTWEDDGNEHGDQPIGYCTGISNLVITRSRMTGVWLAAYTAGHSPNNAGSGGVGLAWSHDLKSWTRYVGNPVLTSASGFSNAIRLLRVTVGLPQSGGPIQAALPFAWLFVQDVDGKLYRIPISDPPGVISGTLQAIPGLNGYSPLGWDHNGCWGIIAHDWTDTAGFGSVDIYSHGDCATTPGILLANMTASWLSHKGIAGVSLIERSAEGGIVAGPTLLVTCWDSWASTTAPQAVQVGVPEGMVPVLDPITNWAYNAQ